MTDDKKPTDEFGDIDWDQALSEWEHTSFDPEVAKDVATTKPGSLAGASRPLYRPPTAPKAIKPRPPLPAAARIWTETIDADEAEATRIARVPEELLQDRGDDPQTPAPDGPAPPFDFRARGPLTTRPADHEIGPAIPDDVRVAIDPAVPGVDPAPIAKGPALLVPSSRQYDPNEVTELIGDAALGPARSATQLELLEQGSEASGDWPASVGPLPGTRPVPQTRTWADERPASEWLSAATCDAFEKRAIWLEQEAQVLVDRVARARALLACSEIFATIGHRERAQALAAEARDVAPSLPLAHRQARTLMPRSLSDCEDCVEALDAEASLSPNEPSRVHSMLLAAEALRIAGQDEAASNRLESATRMAAGDVRAGIVLAARALARDASTDPALRVPDAPNFGPVAAAIRTCLRLRGVGRDAASEDTRRGQDLSEGIPIEERSPAEVLVLARQALDRGDVAEGAPLVAELATLPELASAAKWLAASLGATRATRRADSARWLGELAVRGDVEARRGMVARAVELGDPELLTEAMGRNGPLTSAERVVLCTLARLPLSATDARLDATASTEGMQVLAAAVTALSMPDGPEPDEQVKARAKRTVGSANARALTRLARLLAASAPRAEIEAAIEAIGGGQTAEVRAVALEMASRAGRTSEVSSALEAWGAGWGSREEGAVGALAAALVAERAGDRARALEAFKAARVADPSNEAALRAVASLEQVDLVAEMNELADDLGDGPRGAIARLEAVARGEGILPEPTRAHLLERAHNAAPALPIASFLAERIARRSGDIDEVLRWVRERGSGTTDAVEGALDAVREALLVADREPGLAAQRLEEAHRARPNDIALRELYERMGAESPEARASWREQRAAGATGAARTLLLLDAAREYEQANDEEGGLRCAEAAGANDTSLGGVARERAELRALRVSRLADELLTRAKTAGEARPRREAYERLAALDATARQDHASAFLWHRAILEEFREYGPSLRYVEHHLIGEGRTADLEPIASAIAIMLRGTGSGECAAHAELAVRLHLSAADARWDETRVLVELAAAEVEPSLWSLRMLQAHSRARGDDASFLAATLQLLDRTSRPAEKAALLVLSGEAALRLGRLEQARSLLERASAADPGDIVSWTLLADVHRRAGDARGAAEMSERLARTTVAAEQQLRAWCEAGRIWLDEEKDEERAIFAFEAAAAIDVAHQDVFDRLSQVYAAREMLPELATLLERRIRGIPDSDERAAMEVRRGEVLLQAGDIGGARSAFEAALAARPEHVGALAKLADLCVSQCDWNAAEQAFVSLARLLPTADDQRNIYARLGVLYANQLVNLPRAEIAFKEVLRRMPEDVDSTERLIDVYRRQNDAANAAELQQDLIARARSPEEKRKRVLELAVIHEQTGHDDRHAEQTLEAARREFPQDVALLRALAEFYARHHQAPAVQILLDRAGGDARRALAAGRVSPALFEVLATVFDLRERPDAARVTRAILAALDGLPAQIAAFGHRAFDSGLDDRLAPEGLTPSLRALLAKAGDALDQVTPLDSRALKVTPLPAEAPLARLAASVGQGIGLGAVQVFVSPRIGSVCVPVGSSPPAIVVGEALDGEQRFAAFLVLRALKLVQARASVLARAAPTDIAILVSAWLKCFNPTWQPQGVNVALLNAAGGRLQAALPRNLSPDVALIALDAAGTIGSQAGTLGTLAVAWANRVALLSLGDTNAALDAIAAAGGAPAGAPRDPRERAAWIARTPEALDLVAFAVTDAFADVRAGLGVDP